MPNIIELLSIAMEIEKDRNELVYVLTDSPYEATTLFGSEYF